MGKRMIMGGTDFNTPLVPPKGWREKLAFWLKGGYANIAIYQAGFNSRKEYYAWLKEQEELASLDGGNDDGGRGNADSGSGNTGGPGGSGDTGGGDGGSGGPGPSDPGGSCGRGKGRAGTSPGRGHGRGGVGRGHGKGVGGGRGHK